MSTRVFSLQAAFTHKAVLEFFFFSSAVPCTCLCARQIFYSVLERSIPRQLQPKLSFSRHFMASGLLDKYGGAPRFANSSDKVGRKRIHSRILQTSMKRQLWSLIQQAPSKGFRVMADVRELLLMYKIHTLLSGRRKKIGGGS